MLRSLLTFVAPLVLLVVTFLLVYVWRAQPNASLSTHASGSDAPSSLTPSNSIVGRGTRPSAMVFKNGVLESEFKGDQYTPQKDGSFFVTNPVDTFYMSDGQVMKVTGDNGVLYCDTPAKSTGTSFTNASATPRNGWLHHVRIELYHDPSSTHCTLWMETDNIHFDNDTLRIFTGTYVNPAGQTIPADQVPVTMRGDDYEFDGNGLTLWWNGKNRRLQRLEVYHGKRLEIKNPNKLSLPGMTPAQPPAKLPGVHNTGLAASAASAAAAQPPAKLPRVDGAAPAPPHAPVATLLPSADPSAAVLAQDTTSAPQPPTPYHAVFNDNVVIKDTVRTLATSDLMIVDFLQGSNATKAAPTTNAIPPPSPGLNQAQGPGQPTTSPAPAEATQPASSASAKSPTTKAVNGPITITWTGKLLVTPLETEPMLPIVPGQSVVRLIGKPVTLTPEGSIITAATATYRSPDGAVQLRPLPGSVVEMTRSTGMHLTTGSLAYDPATSLATLLGVSQLDVPVGTQKQKMVVNWTRTGVLHTVKTAGQSQSTGVDRVNLAGDVTVVHPQFSLDSQRLQLDLLPSGTDSSGEQLRLLTADDDVKCRLNHPGKPADEGIDSDELKIRTEPHGKEVVAREVIATGNVHAFDPDQSLTAGYMDALLLPKAVAASPNPPATRMAPQMDALEPPKADAASPNPPATRMAPQMNASAPPNTVAVPATQPTDAAAVDLDSLDARTNVHALLKSGATADSDRLRVTGMGDQQKLDLTSDTTAILKDGKGGWLAGSIIHIIPSRSIVTVDGPGKMHTLRRSPSTRPANSAPPRPVDVTWTDSMKMVGSQNIVDVLGHVQAQNLDTDGTLSTITGDKAHLDLMDAPKQATTKQATTSPATQPDSIASAAGGKQLKKLTMTGHIVGLSDLIAPGGRALRQGQLYGNQLIYTTADGKIQIPGPGKMYVQNHVADAKTPSGNLGAMAISWKKQAVYDQIARTITFTGDTVVGFQQDQKNTKPQQKPAAAPGGLAGKGHGPMHLQSDQVIVTLASPPPAAKGKPAPSGQQKMQVSHLRAIGQVRFNSGQTEMTCGTADYDPATSILTATSTPNQPVQVFSGNVTGTFDTAVYDAAKEEVEKTTGSHVKAQ